MSERPRPSAADPDVLRVLMDYLPDAIYFKDLESRFVRVNKALARAYGLKSPPDAVGKTDADFVTKEFARATYEMEQEIIRTGEARVDVEEKLVWPDGHVTWMSTTKIPFRNKAGKTIGTFGLSRDISRQKQAEDEVRRSEALYRSLVDNLPQNFFHKDREGRVTFANRQYCSTLGKTLKELLGKTDFDLFPAELAKKYREDDQRVMQTGVALEAVEAHQPPGKPVLYVRVVKSPLLDADRRVTGVQVIFWEVSAPPAP